MIWVIKLEISDSGHADGDVIVLVFFFFNSVYMAHYTIAVNVRVVSKNCTKVFLTLNHMGKLLEEV